MKFCYGTNKRAGPGDVPLLSFGVYIKCSSMKHWKKNSATNRRGEKERERKRQSINVRKRCRAKSYLVFSWIWPLKNEKSNDKQLDRINYQIIGSKLAAVDGQSRRFQRVTWSRWTARWHNCSATHSKTIRKRWTDQTLIVFFLFFFWNI